MPTPKQKLVQTGIMLAFVFVFTVFAHAIGMTHAIDGAFPNIPHAGLWFLGCWYAIYICSRLWVIWLPKNA